MLLENMGNNPSLPFFDMLQRVLLDFANAWITPMEDSSKEAFDEEIPCYSKRIPEVEADFGNVVVAASGIWGVLVLTVMIALVAGTIFYVIIVSYKSCSTEGKTDAGAKCDKKQRKGHTGNGVPDMLFVMKVSSVKTRHRSPEPVGESIGVKSFDRPAINVVFVSGDLVNIICLLTAWYLLVNIGVVKTGQQCCGLINRSMQQEIPLKNCDQCQYNAATYDSNTLIRQM